MATIKIKREYSLTCHFCGDSFVSGWPAAKFCSGKCRQRMYRWRKRLPFLYNEAERYLDDLASYLKFPDSRPHAVALMKTLKQRVDELWINNSVKVIR